MSRDSLSVAGAVLAFLSGAFARVDPGTLVWRPGRPLFRDGARLALLCGDPEAAGLFVARLRLPPGHDEQTPCYTSNNHLCIIDGDLSVSSGEPPGRRIHHALRRGSLVQLPAGVRHRLVTSAGADLLLLGHGPCQATDADPTAGALLG